jgi:hypothetical protein
MGKQDSRVAWYGAVRLSLSTVERGIIMIRKKIGMVTFLACLMTIIATAGPAQAAAINFTSVTGGFLDGVQRVIGWEFTVSSQDITVDKLGVYDHNQDGLQVAHSVAIYDYLVKIAVVTATVPAGISGTLSGLFRYTSTPATQLNANTKYIIAASWPGNADRMVWSPDIITPPATIVNLSVAPAITLGLMGTGLPPSGRYEDTTSALEFPDKRLLENNTYLPGDPRVALAGPNFTFSTVPLPATLPLLLSGLLRLVALRKCSSK